MGQQIQIEITADKAADITGVDKKIIQRFHIILQTIRWAVLMVLYADKPT